ncbi:MAG: sigma-E factor negative regulatory protein [Rhodocyclaceae bacterium]|nr:sigma-E factor negative regulatory protein [Rhodocyclaceae bacterium]MDP2196354.1 sigma-E factor negative regulatory protein [Rhodocyclaceae bacterium]
MNLQQQELSALLDGELEPHEVRPTLTAAVREPELRGNWLAYVLIGDQLRQERTGARDLTAGVMAKIRAEPVVLAPRNLQLARRRNPMLALAASAAGVAVVGWLALADNAQLSPPGNLLAAAAPANMASAVVTVQINTAGAASAVPPAPTFEVAARGDMSEYLLAHHTQSATFRLGDNAGHVRTVTMTGGSVLP